MAHGWSIVEPAFSAGANKAYEGLFTQGSGYLHVRGSLEEHLLDDPQNVTFTRRPGNTTAERFRPSKAKWGTYVPGVYAPHPHLDSEMVNLPFFLDLAPYVGREKLDMEAGRVLGYRRELLLDSATLVRTLRWRPASGGELAVRFERFVSAARPSLCVQRLTIRSRSRRATRVTLRAGIDADVRTNGFDHFTEVRLARAGRNALECRVKTNGGDEATIRSELSADGARWALKAEPKRARLSAGFTIPAGGRLVVEKRTAVATGRDLPARPPAEVLAAAAPLSHEKLRAEHAAVWRKRWAGADVVIEGDPTSQEAMRAAVYHLLRCHVPGDDRVAIEAKGFAGDAYRGHFFWDTEMYLLPFFLYTDPGMARGLVDFRVRNLPAARANAARYGYAGARYPWQCNSEGRECGAMWQYTDHEVHVTAAVAYGLIHYARATDTDYLKGPPAEVLVETARYWMQRMDWRAGEDHPSLLGVMGPDEYTPISSNNSYTNRMVSLALDAAAGFGEHGGAPVPEREAFASAAAKLPVVRNRDGVVLQCEEFELLAEPRFDQTWPDRSKPFAMFVPQERLYRTKCLKQADVILLMMLFPHEFSDEEVARAWDYYLPVTTHDSSLSAAIHAIVALRLGKDDQAWDFWKQAAGKDLDVPHGGAAEGIHIAAAGGTWQVAVLGFAGLATAMQADLLTLRPRLPKAWTRLAFPIVWKGCPAHVDITPAGTTIANRGAGGLTVGVNGRTRTIPPGRSERFT